MATAAHLDPLSSASDMSDRLKALQRDGGPYVHHQEVSFANGKIRDSYRNYLVDVDDRDILVTFLRASTTNNCKIALFSAPSENWVGKEDPEDDGQKGIVEDWHAWAAMMVKDAQRGQHLLIYDSDAKDVDDDTRITDALRGLQRTLWKQASARGSFTVWYSTDQTHAGTDLCLTNAYEKVKYWASLADDRMEEGDGRLAGFQRLTKR